MSRYATPAAFRAALTDRLRAFSEHTEWTPQQLHRQFAYDRLLQRLYMMDEEWIVKGAVALLARELGVRGSLDVDVYRAKATDAAEADVRKAAALDIGDWFRFELGPRRPVGDESSAIRLPVVAYISQQPWERFHIDLVGLEVHMTGQPDDVPAITRVEIPELQQQGYRVYPLADHVADKIVATFDRYGEAQRPSTRYRDLVDLIAITRGASVDADEQLTALRSEAQRRGVVLPQSFDAPDRTLWERGYAQEASRSLLTDAQTLDEALTIVRRFTDPLLQGTARGQWDQERCIWSGAGQAGGAVQPRIPSRHTGSER